MKISELINKFKRKPHVPIVCKGGFSVYHSGTCCTEGHFYLPEDSTKDDLGYAIIATVAKLGREYKVPLDNIIKQINTNLKTNGFVYKIND